MRIVLIVIGIIIFTGSSSYATVIFEDNFNYSTQWTPSNAATGSFFYPNGGITDYEPSPVSAGKSNTNSWNGWIRYNPNAITVNTTGGYTGGVLDLNYGTTDDVQVGLIKWLGATGYNDIYVRWRFKFDDNWCWGNGTNGSMVYFKTIRLWCGIDLENLGGKNPSSTLDFPYYAIFNWQDDNYSTFSPFLLAKFVNNTTESVPTCPGTGWGPPCNEVTWWNNSAGQFSTLVSPLSSGCVQGTQQWHTIEHRLKLATSVAAADGVYQVWVDGVEITGPSDPYDNSPYISDDGGNITYIILGDNGTGMSYWPASRHLYIDDFVISTSYIGTDYQIGDNTKTSFSGGTLNGGVQIR